MNTDDTCVCGHSVDDHTKASLVVGGYVSGGSGECLVDGCDCADFESLEVHAR